MRTAGRAIALGVLTTLVASALAFAGFRPAVWATSPGFVAAWHGTGTEAGGFAAFFGVNALVWSVAWLAGLAVLGRVLRPARRESLGEPRPGLSGLPRFPESGNSA